MLQERAAVVNLEGARTFRGLDASKETAKKNPKRVLGSLTDGDAGREEQCWTVTELDRLRTRGATNGLAAFLDEIEEKLAPLFAG